MCTCGSMPPGITMCWVASITRFVESSARVPGAASAPMVSPATATSQVTTPSGVTTSPPRMMRSNITPPTFAKPGGVMFDLIIRGGDVVTPEGVVTCDVAVAGETIGALAAPGTLADDSTKRVIDATQHIVMPGGIDPHVHMHY